MAKNYFGITDTGKMRKNNEDTFFAKLLLNNTLIAACVIDGVGGYNGGEVAARLAHDAILKVLDTATEPASKMKDGMVAADEQIHHEKNANTDNDQMACVVTLAIADVTNNKFYYAHVGDTRLYLLRDNTLVKITKDHSFVGFLEDSGRLSEDAAMNHPKRNEINKALGFDPSISAEGYIETGDSPFLPGDILLLCSDGLSDMVSNSAMTSILNTKKSLEEKGRQLIKAANDAGGKDNITAVLVHNDKPVTKQEATRPVAVKKSESIPAKEVDTANVKETVSDKKKDGSSILTILGLILLAAFVWVLYQNYSKNKLTKNEIADTATHKIRNAHEQKFVDSINNNTTNEVFVLNLDGQPLTITDSIIITRDSLHIIGNGVSLVRGESYKGPALVISPSCKYLLLDSLTIENFDVGVQALTAGVHLKNVQFKNCRTPLQYQYSFDGKNYCYRQVNRYFFLPNRLAAC